jgi:hypothetical protein
VSETRWPLSPRAARVFYGLADAWIPAHDGLPGGGDLDVVAALALQLRSPGERRRLERALWLLEWSPRLLLRSPRGVAWMERDARRAWLARLEGSRIGAIARGIAALRAIVLASYRDATRRRRETSTTEAASSAANDPGSGVR